MHSFLGAAAFFPVRLNLVLNCCAGQQGPLPFGEEEGDRSAGNQNPMSSQLWGHGMPTGQLLCKPAATLSLTPTLQPRTHCFCILDNPTKSFMHSLSK